MEYYKEIAEIAGGTPDYKSCYDALNSAFLRFLDEATKVNRILLVGAFAKMDYLLKEHDADRLLKRRVNSARVRMRHKEQLSPEVLRRYFLTDARTLCEFISLVTATPLPHHINEIYPPIAGGNDEGDDAGDNAVEYTEENAKTSGINLLAEYLRMVVHSHDNEFIYGSIDNNAYGDAKVCVTHAYTEDSGIDHKDILPLLSPGSQINIIRPHEKGGVIFADLIIYEPDYLVDISTIAGCFESYTTSPLVAMIKRITPAPYGDAINLGNFAGQMLDEEIHNSDSAISAMRPYSESAHEFFRKNALALAANPPGSDFNQEARRQRINIHRALKENMPKEVKAFNTANVMVEPSFFSEMLGLQGRMDMLQLDFRVVVEQKSGKGSYVRDDTLVTPIARERHYVQLLLYMAILRYNYRERYERNNELRAFLLYSKYERSLVGKGFAPRLIATAFSLRNRIVWQELRNASGGYKLLDTITPDTLLRGKPGALWHRFTEPQLKAILDPIHLATPLELKYFHRFMTFISREHLLAKVGNRRKQGSGFAATWQLDSTEKLEAGNIYMNLRLETPDMESRGNVEEVALRFTDSDLNAMSNFRTGDTVILYSYTGPEPDARRNMVFRCNIKDIGAERITLQLRAAQSDLRVFTRDRAKPWAIEHDFLESSYSAYYRSLHSFLTASSPRRDLILLQREPETDKSATLKGNYGDFNALALRVKQARDIFIIIGPPGTGKTSFGMLTTLQEELLEPGSDVLIMSYTNRAIDEICGKLVESGIEFLRIGGLLSCAPEYREYVVSERMRACANIHEVAERVKATRVFVGTTASLNSQPSLFRLKHFTLAIVDEASQILEPHIIGLLSQRGDYGRDAIDKFVFIGDHKQLPAVVQQEAAESAVDDEDLNAIHLTDCRLSLFERLLRRYGDNPEVTYMLTRQGRMHRDIASFPNKFFYEGHLDVVPLPHQLKDLERHSRGDSNRLTCEILNTHRMSFIDVVPDEKSVSCKVNAAEARVIARLVKDIHAIEGAAFDTNKSVGVIIPYRNQIAAIRKELESFGVPALRDICIDTVERFQGSQRKYIIYGFTAQKEFQLAFLTENSFEENGHIIDRKLNVALTRAKEYNILVGNARLLRRERMFAQLIDYIRGKGAYFAEKG